MHGPDIISVARATGRPVLEVARGFFLLGERLDDRLAGAAARGAAREDPLATMGLHSMEDDLYTIRRQIIESDPRARGRPAHRRGRRGVPGGSAAPPTGGCSDSCVRWRWRGSPTSHSSRSLSASSARSFPEAAVTRRRRSSSPRPQPRAFTTPIPILRIARLQDVGSVPAAVHPEGPHTSQQARLPDVLSPRRRSSRRGPCRRGCPCGRAGSTRHPLRMQPRVVRETGRSAGTSDARGSAGCGSGGEASCSCGRGRRRGL